MSAVAEEARSGDSRKRGEKKAVIGRIVYKRSRVHGLEAEGELGEKKEGSSRLIIDCDGHALHPADQHGNPYPGPRLGMDQVFIRDRHFPGVGEYDVDMSAEYESGTYLK